MTKTKTTAIGLGITAIISGGMDASVLNEEAVSRVEIVANERVEAKQVENTVETKFPWKGERGLTVKYDMGEPSIRERFADKRDREVITEVVDFGEGGFKIDILLNERPATNRFCYEIAGAENYDFFYQPEITDEEAEASRGGEEDTRTLEEIKRSMRPDDIVGSYAVYHKTLKNNVYQTGKVMHIPRPQVWELNDEENTKEWAELSYDDKEGLCVTARQEFLDEAEYPVRIDPTFGYTSQGASEFGVYESSDGTNYLGSTQHALSEAGTFTTMNAYMRKNVAKNFQVIASIYGNTAGAPLTRLGYTNSQLITTSMSLISFTLTTPLDLAIGTYWPSANMSVDAADNTNQDVYLAYDSGGTGYLQYLISGNPPDATLAGGSPQTRTFSVYATYTASGGGATSTPQSVIFFE